MKLSSKNIQKLIDQIHKKRRKLLSGMMDSRPIMIGSVYEVLRKCGNPYCRCNQRPSHPQTLFIHKVDGKRICQFIRREDETWVKSAWTEYRAYKKALKEIRALMSKELELLRAQMWLRGAEYKTR